MSKRKSFTPKTVRFSDGKTVTFNRPVSKRRAANSPTPKKGGRK